jgi:hypothetical protein
MIDSSGWLIRWAAILALWPASIEAQTVAGSFEDLGRAVPAGQTVLVTDSSGVRIKGKIAARDENSLSLTTDGRTRTFMRSEVSTVRLPDGLANGVLIGAGAGLGAALSILAILGSQDGYVLPSARVGAPLLLSGAGALVGALVDRVHDGGRLLYVSPGQTSAVVVSPILSGDRHGLSVSLRF